MILISPVSSCLTPKPAPLKTPPVGSHRRIYFSFQLCDFWFKNHKAYRYKIWLVKYGIRINCFEGYYETIHFFDHAYIWSDFIRYENDKCKVKSNTKYDEKISNWILDWRNIMFHSETRFQSLTQMKTDERITISKFVWYYKKTLRNIKFNFVKES